MHSFKRSIKAPKPCFSPTCSLQKKQGRFTRYNAHILSFSVIYDDAQADLRLCCTNIPMSLHS